MEEWEAADPGGAWTPTESRESRRARSSGAARWRSLDGLVPPPTTWMEISDL
jgi:hypothetical protein